MGLDDFFDPRTWVKEAHECRIYGDDYANIYAVVDEIDYHYLIQWSWRPKTSKVHKGTRRPKVYLCRTIDEYLGPSYRDEDGKKIRSRYSRTVYLHTVVMERTGIPLLETNKTIIVDHANGDGLCCTRSNLRWATISFNNKNIYGSHEKVLL